MAQWRGTMLGRHGDLSVSRFVCSWSRREARSAAELAAARKEDK